MELSNEYVSIPDTYRNLTIFITGGTGYLGKVMVEKLLRSCPDIRHIYLLVRDKRGKSVHERLEDIFCDPLFSTLEVEQPGYRHKVTAIAGDFNVKGLNINLDDKNQLIREVDIIFHGAAAVRFDKELKYMYNINVRGTMEMIELANEMLQLKVFVYISTAYSNCPNEDISEVLYPSPISYQDVTDIVENVNDDILNIMEQKILQDWPNTYTFTKAIAESTLNDFGKRIPSVVIFRPSIVVGTSFEPILGWMDNMNGPVGLSVGAGKGVLHVTLIDMQKKVDIVPVDMCVNALIAISWKEMRNDITRKEQYPAEFRSSFKDSKTESKIYNYVTSTQNPLFWKDWMNYAERAYVDTPMLYSIWYNFTINTTHWPVYIILVCLLHYLPAFFIDNIAKLIKNKLPNFRKIYKKIDKAFAVLKYFSTRDWNFTDKNIQHLLKCLNEKDRQVFKFNMKELDWKTFFKNSARGSRHYLLKEDPKTLPAAKIHYKRLYWIHQITKALLLYLGYRITWYLIPLLKNR